MFKRLIKNKKAQQTAEYALLISLVVAAVIAMQTYAQRSIQAKIRDASKYMTSSTTEIGNTTQYEPYYLKSQYQVTRNDQTTETLEGATQTYSTNSERNRLSGGFQSTDYNATGREND